MVTVWKLFGSFQSKYLFSLHVVAPALIPLSHLCKLLEFGPGLATNCGVMVSLSCLLPCLLVCLLLSDIGSITRILEGNGSRFKCFKEVVKTIVSVVDHKPAPQPAINPSHPSSLALLQSHHFLVPQLCC